MQLDEALAGITALGIDTAPFIYLVERHPTYVDIVLEVVRRVDTGTIAGYSSVVTLTEVLTLPKRLGNVAVELAYRNILLRSRHFALLSIDPAIAERAHWRSPGRRAIMTHHLKRLCGAHHECPVVGSRSSESAVRVGRSTALV